MRVLIIGAGLGGLTLAHGLRAAGIDAQVFERRPSPEDQPASYGIHLNAGGLHALHRCLPASNWEALVSGSTAAPDTIRFRDEQLRVLATRDRQPPTSDPNTQRRAISRAVLRDALLLGLNRETHSESDPVQWGKAFERYETLPSGGVKVWFKDHSSAVGDLLVGADGSNSRVRAQRLPGLDRVDLGIVNIAGRLPLTPELGRRLPATFTDGSVNNIVPAGPGWLFASTWRINTAGQEREEEFYLVWAWAAARNSYPAGVESLPPAELQQLVLDRVSGWAPEVGQLVAASETGSVAALKLLTMPPLHSWTPDNVTLLGDAIHNMTPMAGIGANTALRDAGALLQALTTPPNRPLLQAVANYETGMRLYANGALALSTRNARSAASEARLPRSAFRTALRLAEAVPFVKQRMFGPVNLPTSPA